MRIFDATLSTLERSLDVRLARQAVLAGNVANADTPGFNPGQEADPRGKAVHHSGIAPYVCFNARCSKLCPEQLGIITRRITFGCANKCWRQACMVCGTDRCCLRIVLILCWIAQILLIKPENIVLLEDRAISELAGRFRLCTPNITRPVNIDECANLWPVAVPRPQGSSANKVCARTVSGQRQPVSATTNLFGMGCDPLQCRIGIIWRSREWVFRCQPVINGNDNSAAPCTKGAGNHVLRI